MSQKDRYAIKKMIRYCDEITAILHRIDHQYDVFVNDSVYQYALTMCLLQIGELVNHCSDQLITAHPEVAWKHARAMRNMYAHDYDSAKPSIVWQTLNDDIPELKDKLVHILAEMEQAFN